MTSPAVAPLAFSSASAVPSLCVVPNIGSSCSSWRPDGLRHLFAPPWRRRRSPYPSFETNPSKFRRLLTKPPDKNKSVLERPPREALPIPEFLGRGPPCAMASQFNGPRTQSRPRWGEGIFWRHRRLATAWLHAPQITGRKVGRQALEIEFLKGGAEKRTTAEKRDYIRHHRPHGCFSVAQGCHLMGLPR